MLQVLRERQSFVFQGTEVKRSENEKSVLRLRLKLFGTLAVFYMEVLCFQVVKRRLVERSE